MQLTPQAGTVMKLAEVHAKGESISIYHMMLALDDFTKLAMGKGMGEEAREKLEKIAQGH